MTTVIAKKIAYFFMEKNFIPKEKLAEYEYGFEVLIADVFILIIIAVIALFAGFFWGTVVYMAAFILLRRQVGGIHMDSHLKCNAVFISTYLLCLLIVFKIPQTWIFPAVIIGVSISFILIYIFAPVSHKNRPVTEKALKKFRKRGLILSAVISVVSLLLLFIKPTFALSCMLSALSVGIYIVGAVAKGQKGGLSVVKYHDQV